MEGKTFTVREAANIMGCKKSTIYQLLEDGWLSAPEGRPKGGEGVLVSEKSLYQFMILDGLSRVPIRTLKALKKARKEFERLFSKNANANCLINRGICETPEPTPSPGNSELKCCLHYDFAVQYQSRFARRARQLEPNDPAMQDDLVQEMSLAVLEYNKPASVEFLFELATNRAKNYLKYEACRGMASLDEARHVSDKRLGKMASLSAYIDELLQRGVPQYWIEQVIGFRLEVG